MRYCVLYDLSHPDDKGHAVACGVAIDRGTDGVEVVAPADWAMPNFIREPTSRLAPDMTREDICPGDERYFDEAMLSLSRSFALSSEYS